MDTTALDIFDMATSAGVSLEGIPNPVVSGTEMSSCLEGGQKEMTAQGSERERRSTLRAMQPRAAVLLLVAVGRGNSRS